jgi:type I restriction enzyme M protein
MRSGFFKPYSGVSTAVLLFVKGGETKSVWFYNMEADGYSLDDKRLGISENDIPDVIARWTARDPRKGVDRREKAFFVPVAEIIENKYDLSINRYKESPFEPVELEAPKAIVSKLHKLEEEIAKGLEELETML